MKIPSPTKQIISLYQEKWDTLENYVAQERSLRKLFTQTYPNNTELDEVLIKVCSLNDFYSTNIFSPFSVAKHIISLDIDKGLSNNDTNLVNDIAKVNVNGKKQFNFYSFATKYCSHHKPLDYPIYDSYVEKLLMALKKQDNFFKFHKADLKVYSSYKNILIKFRKFYELEEFDLKQIDKYLWQAGKELFPKSEYNKESSKERFTYTSALGLSVIKKG
ncbi:hypothetical protein [Draconibacterium sp.]|uniref:hypothetical protein n=1 Tax=Draconibacterium sp. TaxID=1965318 RepID=UPI0035633D86